MATWEGIESTFRSARKIIGMTSAQDRFSRGIDTKLIEAGKHAV